MSTAAPIITGPLGGAQAALVSSLPLWFALRADSNLFLQFTLFHRDVTSQQWTEFARGRGSMSVRVEQPTDSLRADSIGWIVLCSPLNAGTFPVHVQLFQGTDASGFAPITPVVKYNVNVGAGHVFEPINDFVRLS